MNLKVQMRYNTAIYCRLSKDDGNSDESQSITSQRETLRNYAINNDYNIIDYYIDDGYSGTQFDNRPEFKRMISDIENKLINCVIVKDLSRLGRNYLKTGYYTEEFFPMHDVRFIAVNDAHDSLQENDFLPFKNIINEWYAKDISKKIKSVFRHRQKEGTLVINSPYGYKNDKTKGRVIDPVTATIVRFIFTSFINHKTIKNIYEELTDKKVLTPKFYKSYFEGCNNNLPESYDLEDTYKWTKSCIYKILNDYQYTGALTCDKTRRTSFKNKKPKLQNKNDWIVHEDRFELIVTKEEFGKVQYLLKAVARPKLSLDINKYNGLIYCKDCGKKLTFIRTDKYLEGLYTCKVKSCGTKRLSLNCLDKIIRNEIGHFKQYIIRNEKPIIDYLDSNPKQKFLEKKENVLNQLYKEQESLLISQTEALEAKINKEVTEDVYDKVLSNLNSKLADIKSKIEMTNNKTFNLNGFNGVRNFIDNIKCFDDNAKLTSSMLSTFVKRIEYTFICDKCKKTPYEVDLNIEYYGIDWLVRENEK